MAKKKQTLKEIQAMYEEKLERVKANAEAENIKLKEEIAELKKQLKDK